MFPLENNKLSLNYQIITYNSLKEQKQHLETILFIPTTFLNYLAKKQIFNTFINLEFGLKL